jgi:disulfide oxidoreductase YuzD
MQPISFFRSLSNWGPSKCDFSEINRQIYGSDSSLPDCDYKPISKTDSGWISTELKYKYVSGHPLRKKGYHKYLGASKSFDSLEIYKVFWFKNILVSQKIYAIVYVSII